MVTNSGLPSHLADSYCTFSFVLRHLSTQSLLASHPPTLSVSSAASAAWRLHTAFHRAQHRISSHFAPPRFIAHHTSHHLSSHFALCSIITSQSYSTSHCSLITHSSFFLPLSRLFMLAGGDNSLHAHFTSSNHSEPSKA